MPGHEEKRVENAERGKTNKNPWLPGCETFMANYAPSEPKTKRRKSRRNTNVHGTKIVHGSRHWAQGGRETRTGTNDSANVKSAEIAQVQQDKRRGRQSDAQATDDAHAQPSQTTTWKVASIWCSIWFFVVPFSLFSLAQLNPCQAFRSATESWEPFKASRQ